MTRTSIRLAACAVLALAFAGCNSDLTKTASPLTLIASSTQAIHQIDLAGGANCDQSLGTVDLQVISTSKNPSSNDQFSKIRVTGYHVSYARTDGGKLVPAPFDRAADMLLGPGEKGSMTFLAFLPEAYTQAPFAALQPMNGGRDPDTGSPYVRMNVMLDIFGQTLGGDRVSAQTLLPMDFCYNCGGCK